MKLLRWMGLILFAFGLFSLVWLMSLLILDSGGIHDPRQIFGILIYLAISAIIIVIAAVLLWISSGKRIL